MKYSDYSDLLGRRYECGDHDCYGLARRLYEKKYGLTMTSYARPEEFAHSGLDLISGNLVAEGFQHIDVSLNRLEDGDGLLFRLNGAPLVNHIGVYVGNQMFIHHLWNGVSKEEALDTRWKSRVVSVVRHPDLAALNQPDEQVNVLDFIPEHIRLRKGI